MKKIFIILLVASASLFNPLFSNTLEPVEHPGIEAILQELPTHGILMQHQSDGYIYLKISEEYLDKLVPILEEMTSEHLVKGSSIVGAHASVIRPDLGEPAFWNIPELGQTFSYQLISIGTVELQFDAERERVWILEVYSEELEQLRMAYGLTPRIRGKQNFHISIASKMRQVVKSK